MQSRNSLTLMYADVQFVNVATRFRLVPVAATSVTRIG